MEKPCAIVLGAAVWPGATPSPTLRRRAERAAELYHEGRVSRIIASGGLGLNPPSEAEMIREIVTALGVPETAVLLEDRSSSTRENLAFSKRLLPEGGAALIVTDAWHLPRARLIAWRLGIRASGASASRSGTSLRDITRAILREIAALLWEILRPMPRPR